MLFERTTLRDVYVIHVEQRVDNRGFFGRTFCQNEFAERGLRTSIAQSNVSYNTHAGTLRGLHFQREPHPEAKLVACIRGAIWDVVVDLRPDSETYKQWAARELNEVNGDMLYIPEGCAHGFQTLKDDSVVFYQMFEFYYPDLAAGVRWDDPAFNIIWPDVDQRIISEKDLSYPDFDA